jgi:hypothetical protein
MLEALFWLLYMLFCLFGQLPENHPQIANLYFSFAIANLLWRGITFCHIAISISD